MVQYTSVLFFLLLMVIQGNCLRSYVNASHPRPWKVLYYPKKTLFHKADLIDFGCVIFIKKCPRFYKRNMICARHYDGHYKTFENYCEMEYENCNSWRQNISIPPKTFHVKYCQDEHEVKPYVCHVKCCQHNHEGKAYVCVKKIISDVQSQSSESTRPNSTDPNFTNTRVDIVQDSEMLRKKDIAINEL